LEGKLEMRLAEILLTTTMLVFVGCSCGLQPGVEVMVAYPSEAERPIGGSRIHFSGDTLGTGGYIQEGTKVRIIDVNDSDARVYVLDGEHSGKAGKIGRKYLRP
jgi:hypothetical protein